MMDWTAGTYRLDEVTKKFQLPIVIHLTEGYYSETDAEGFSAGDIMTIDAELTIYKVGAFFENDNESVNEDYYVNIADQEILIPLNYKGKLKVINENKLYDNVSELCKDFPRYATVIDNFTVKKMEKVSINIPAGTVIELDRLIPGSIHGPNPEPDNLVIDYKYNNMSIAVAVSTSEVGKFRTESDDNEYTIKDAIDSLQILQYISSNCNASGILQIFPFLFINYTVHRQEKLVYPVNIQRQLHTNKYKLPQVVQFLDDEIKRVYTQDHVEGIENMTTITITDTLRLNRLVTQSILVGHYKPLEGAPTKDTESFRHRTLVVIPLDIADVREIEVNVLEGVTEDIYDEVFLVRNVSDDLKLVDGSLYIDFATKPRITRIESKCCVHSKQTSCGNSATDRLRTKSPTLHFPLLYHRSLDTPSLQFPVVSKKSTKSKLLLQSNKKKHSSKAGKDQGKCDGAHEENDEKQMQILKAKLRVNYEIPPTLVPIMTSSHVTHSDSSVNQNKNHRPKLVMPASPQISRGHNHCNIKKFVDLNVSELVERLNICGMMKLAQICQAEHLDGDYISKLDEEELTKDPFNLSEFHLKKMARIMVNWVPDICIDDS